MRFEIEQHSNELIREGEETSKNRKREREQVAHLECDILHLNEQKCERDRERNKCNNATSKYV